MDVNAAPAANAGAQSATFGFDYSAFGIPAAPGAADKIGLRLRANIPAAPAAPGPRGPAGVTSGLSVSPTGATSDQLQGHVLRLVQTSTARPTPTGVADNANSEGGTIMS